MRSAFGFGGQKCSANSRVYVERPVHDELVAAAGREDRAVTVGDPLPRTALIGPVIDERAVERHQQAVAEARRDGTVFTGGERLTDGGLARGFYVEPTVVGRCRPTIACSRTSCSRRSRRSHAVDSLDEALALANDNVYGLTAGIYSEDRPRCSASSTGSRRASCTSTGAPAPRPARGRASSRSAAGRAPARPASPAWSMWYVAQFLREQSHTIVD